jgi:hypothetical protein
VRLLQIFLGMSIALLLSAGPSFADGGVLEFHADRSMRSSGPCPNGIARRAMMRLDGNAPEEVLVVEANSDPPLLVAASVSEPFRLFCDRNLDGECQPEELFEANAGATARNRWFMDVGFPVRLGESALTLSANLSVDIYSPQIRFVDLTEIKGCYEGPLRIGDTEIPSRLIFDPLGSLEADRQFEVERTIVLDTNGDGDFDRLKDPWIAPNGVGWFEGELWSVRTVFTDATAEVSIAPYDGPTGRVEIEGEGIRRFHLRVSSATAPATQREHLCLTGWGGMTYSLPIDNYTVSKTWLRSDTLPKLHFRNDESGHLRVSESATMEANLGGPLEINVSANRLAALFGLVLLDCENCKNASGLTYRRTGPDGDPAELRAPAPSFEIRDSQGIVVVTDQFEYG